MKTKKSFLILFVGFLLVGFLLSTGCRRETVPPITKDTLKVKEETKELQPGKTEPNETKGAPYPPEKPSDKEPNQEKEHPPVPDGPKVGDMQPGNQEFEIKEGKVERKDEKKDGEGQGHSSKFAPPLLFKYYRELPNATPTSLCCPELSVAENGQTIMLTANTWMSLSEDGGATFTTINPTTIFPQVDGGFCCDQVVVYVPGIDMFVWFLQYWGTGGNNRIRMAAQTTAQVRSSNGTAWTYWDFVSDFFTREGTLDYNDVTWGRTNLWWTTQSDQGRVVVRVPLQQIAAKSTINFQFTAGTDALWSHLTQNAEATVFWAGHINNSQLRVYDMRDGNNFYSWRTVNINSWPNGTNTSNCPNGTDWMTFEAGKHYVFGNALQNGKVWFAWLAAAGGGFPKPHVQMVKINPNTWLKEEQVQIWNREIVFMDAYLSTNNEGELGFDLCFGSGGFYPSNAVGVWGDFVVYYPRLSTRCSNRWGDYNHSRRSTSTPGDWVAVGYTMEKNSGGSDIMLPHYIKFGR